MTANKEAINKAVEVDAMDGKIRQTWANRWILSVVQKTRKGSTCWNCCRAEMNGTREDDPSTELPTSFYTLRATSNRKRICMFAAIRVVFRNIPCSTSVGIFQTVIKHGMLERATQSQYYEARTNCTVQYTFEDISNILGFYSEIDLAFNEIWRVKRSVLWYRLINYRAWILSLLHCPLSLNFLVRTFFDF